MTSAFALLVCAVLATAGAQPSATTVPMELSFDRAAAKPGESVALPVYLVSNVNYQEPFQITLEFPEKQLTFEKVALDYLAERARWTMSATVVDHGEKPDRRIVRIDVKPGGSNFFPSGLVAHAHFLVNAGTPDGDIPLEAALVAPAGAKPVPSQEPARISVLSEAVFGCFFYMH